MQWKTDMLRNLLKATEFNLYPHNCIFSLQCMLQKGWLAGFKVCEVSLQKLSHHVCLPDHVRNISEGGIKT
jgi:hypothetical protein